MIPKTYKLFIAGAFPRSESGRSLPVEVGGRVLAHVSHASRKDLRDAVEAARGALPRWWEMTPFNRGQVLYRMAEMLDGRAAEFAEAIASVPAAESARRGSAGRGTRGAAKPLSRSATLSAARREVEACVDRLVGFAGWADKHAEILGRRAPVAGPYHVFTHPEPCGVVAVVAPDAPPLLGALSLMSAALVAGNAAVALASEANPLPAAILGEVLATSDLPGGVVNILTGRREELIPHLALHREVRAILAAGLPPAQTTALRRGAAENLKRVTIDPRADLDAWLDHDEGIAPQRLEPFVEIKTVWHPVGG